MVIVRLTRYVGLNFKLDVGLYQLDQQVACQRYRQTFLIANAKETAKSWIDQVSETLAFRQTALATV
jgi:hypothetical protein